MGTVASKLEPIELETETDADSETYHSSDEAIESSLQDVVEDVSLDERGSAGEDHESKSNGEAATLAKMDLEDYKVNQTSIEAELGLNVGQLKKVTERGLEASTTLKEDLMATDVESEAKQLNGPAVAANAGLEAGTESNEGFMEIDLDLASEQPGDANDGGLEAGSTLVDSTMALEQAGDGSRIEQDQLIVAPEVASGATAGVALQNEEHQPRLSADDRSGAATELVSEQTGEEQRAESRRPSASGAGTHGILQKATDLTERRESEPALVPSEPPPLGSVDEQSQQGPTEEADTGRIPFFIITNTGRKAASPRLSNETIDFPGARISADKFVGLRYVREGGDVSQSGSASPGVRLLGAIQDFPSRTAVAAGKTVTSLLSVLPSPRRSSSGGEKAVADPTEAGRGGQEKETSTPRDGSASAAEGPASTSGSGSRRQSVDSPELHVWEIIWKDHSKHTQDRPGGTLQQVQFETTKAGFRFIQRIIDIWSLEATETSAMTEAAKAALKAQDLLDTNTDYPFSKPETLTAANNIFPRSLFGKVRGTSNGTPNQPEALSRAASEDLQASASEVERTKSGLSVAERTESGVSVAESVESLSSAKSGASAGGVAIALVASGTKNGYGGGLQHVMIPESDPVAGLPPPEKPGAPLVEGRFLPNMSPHSHVLQQPHIRALAAALPVRFRLSPWVLLYSTWRDGISLQTMYRKAAKKGPCVLVILDTKHNVFGCHTSESWKVHPRYYGSGESFVFQLYPEMRIYRWTRDNNYIMFGTPDSIHIGGGSHFALSVRGDLLSGCTGACETFGNGPLVKPEEYGILHVELWGFQ
ncbi:Oxidation resistance protein [Klebsormidium nitens]|uniref:Oxidation resistance protein 1 n=1 Tax=Klebsormidium nitens TaxID=105231 RepID=A0A1Y1IHF2_KLENI|nr:Oxidation resistance protein [Klebsormidium nitens]|eukprot:GAQ88147.1 Oxidation resistance protein [Klebsormidium nitens]